MDFSSTSLGRVVVAGTLVLSALLVPNAANAGPVGGCTVSFDAQGNPVASCTQVSYSPDQGAIKPRAGSTGGPPRVAQPKVVWTKTYTNPNCVGMDILVGFETDATAYFNINYTPSWSPANPGAPLPAAYTERCVFIDPNATAPPAPTGVEGTPPPVQEAPINVADFSARVAQGLPIPGGNIVSNFNVALLTGAEAHFQIVGLSGGEVGQDVSRGGFNGEVVAQLQSVVWDFGDGSTATGFSVDKTYQSIPPSGRVNITVTTTWVLDGYVYGPILGTLYELQPVVITRTSAPYSQAVNQVISARTENR